MKNKGQALVEFVLILPVIILLIFGSIDIARVINVKSMLENKISDVVTIYEASHDTNKIKEVLDSDIEISINSDSNYTTIILKKKVKPLTPGLIKLSKDFFECEVSRVVYEQ